VSWYEHIENLRIPILEFIPEIEDLQGVGVEIGAGTCWFSSKVSQSNKIEKIFAIERDERRLDLAKERFIPTYFGNKGKINLVKGDFHEIPLEDGEVDFVIIDAALHHSHKLNILLGEISRVLKKDGLLIAIREPVLPRMEPLKSYRKRFFGRQEKKKGEVENIYSEEDWGRFFQESGLDLNIREFF
jgi:ubiquinone/menaquinone biosynthesis C-methylase UbiE